MFIPVPKTAIVLPPYLSAALCDSVSIPRARPLMTVFPFLTAAADAADRAEMLHEMATSGVAMALLVTAVWGVMCAVFSRMQKQKKNPVPKQAEVQS